MATAVESRAEPGDAPRRDPGRLDLAEGLLRTRDPVEAAQRTLDWLASRARVRRAVCALVRESPPGLVALAGLGVHSLPADGKPVALGRGAHHLLGAARGDAPCRLGRDEMRSALPRLVDLTRDWLAVPLAARGARPLALILVAPVRAGAGPDVAWAAELLAGRLGELLLAEEHVGQEERVARERSRLESVINAVTDPILLTNFEGRLIMANSRAESLFASSESDSEGRQRAVALNNMLLSAALSQKAFAESDAQPRELLLVDPTDGTDLLFELLSSVIHDPREGRALVSILRNVTDLRKATQEIEENVRRLRAAEAEARRERDRLDLILSSVTDPILVTDPAGNLVLMNAPAERMFVATEASPESVQRSVRANDARFSSYVSNLFFAGAGDTSQGQLGLAHPESGREVPYEASSAKIVSRRGEVTGVVTLLHDRTETIEKARLYEQLKVVSSQLEEKVREATGELVRQNELLRRQHIQLEQASAAKSQFLANMSHEFRTPLNAILGYTSMLLEGFSGDVAPRQRDSLGRIESNARHLLAIINDLLDLTRIEAGKMPLHLDEFALPELLDEVLTEVAPLVARSRLEVSTRLPPRLPQLRSDRQKVKQIVLNLLTNALKFTPEGAVEVIVFEGASDDRIGIAVRDTGIGISEDDQTKVFEDFRQADSSPTRQYGGAGLGLSICRRLAGMLGGRLSLESRLGCGSTFTLEIPTRLT